MNRGHINAFEVSGSQDKDYGHGHVYSKYLHIPFSQDPYGL